MEIIYVKRGDRNPPLELSLQQANGTPINLSHVDYVKWLMKDESELKIDEHVTIVDAAYGMIKYEWKTGDTDDPGNFLGEFEITYNDGTKLTVPNDEYITVIILEDLG